MTTTSADRRVGLAWLVFLVVEVLAIGILALTSVRGGDPRDPDSRRALTEALGLTDLALWGEAAYCRHPSQADDFAPWSTHPGALDHFPAGSIVPPTGGPGR